MTAAVAAGQVMGLASQVAKAKLFGAGPEMDAFLAASAVPTYLATLLQGVAASVTVPVLVASAARTPGETAGVSGTLLGGAVGVGVALSAAGALLSGPILALATPGLAPGVQAMAIAMQIVVWPTLAAGLCTTLASAHYRAHDRFVFQAVAPTLGALVALGVLVGGRRLLGAMVLPVSATAGAAVAALTLVAPLVGRLRFAPLHHPQVREVLRASWPLVLSGVLVRSTTLVERHAASTMSAGSLSHVSYAYTLVANAAALLATGVSVVGLTRFASAVADGDLRRLRDDVSAALRVLLVFVAPVVAIGIALSEPAVRLLFERGRFLREDAHEVAHLLDLYLLALPAMCVGTILGQALYALRRTRLLANAGVLEATAYVAYTMALVRLLGVSGLPLSYLLYFTISIAWGALVVRRATGAAGLPRVLASAPRTVVTAGVGGAAAHALARATSSPAAATLAGGAVGLGAYLAVLVALRSPELRELRRNLGPTGR